MFTYTQLFMREIHAKHQQFVKNTKRNGNKKANSKGEPDGQERTVFPKG